MVIAIDGTVSAGKSTASRMLAKALGFVHFNTGAVYRAFTLKILNSGHSDCGQDKIIKLLKGTYIEQHLDANLKTKISMDGVDVSEDILTPQISNKVADYSIYPKVRELVKEYQHNLAKTCDCVVEGRDIGTVVFPNADVKFFMTAPAEVRALRRFNDYKSQNKDVTYEDVLKDILLRDKKDMEREISPLKMTDDYILINNSEQSLQAIVEKMKNICILKVKKENKKCL